MLSIWSCLKSKAKTLRLLIEEGNAKLASVPCAVAAVAAAVACGGVGPDAGVVKLRRKKLSKRKRKTWVSISLIKTGPGSR